MDERLDLLQDVFLRYQFLGYGAFRAVWRYDEDSVFKVALNPEGLQANAAELARGGSFEHGGPLSPDPNLCRCWPGEVEGYPVLFMEYITKVRGSHVADYARGYDQEQVGATNVGEIKAYDFH
jgi:hypothetical protein